MSKSESPRPETFLRKHAAGYPSGTGSVTTLNMTDDEKEKALAREAKRQPVGFTQPERPGERPR